MEESEVTVWADPVREVDVLVREWGGSMAGEPHRVVDRFTSRRRRRRLGPYAAVRRRLRPR